MKNKMPEFSNDQWSFLAGLQALGQPVHVSLIGELVPLSPGPFLDLLRRAGELGWLVQTEPDTYRLSRKMPSAAKQKLDRINTPAHLAAFLTRADGLNLRDRLGPECLAGLLGGSGRDLESAALENDMARQAMERGTLDSALSHLESAAARLARLNNRTGPHPLFVSVALDLSDLRLRLGKRLREVPDLLKRARAAAESLGDRRSRALIDLHLGRFSYVSDNLSDALASLVAGLDEVDELGDEDIIAQSSEFVGLYYFLQGRHKEAVKHFDRAMLAPYSRERSPVNFFLPYTFGYCAAYAGQFNRAVGVLDYNRRRYEEANEPGLAVNFRSALGIVLLIMGKKQEAFAHLEKARDESRLHRNQQSLLLAQVGLAHYHFLEGRIEESARQTAESVTEAARGNYRVRNYIFPFILEHLYEFSKLFPTKFPPGYQFDREIDRIINSPNIHLRGSAYRLLAEQGFDREEKLDQIRKNLETSLRYLKRSGDPVETAKTKAQLARLELMAENKDRAAILAREAWKYLAVYDGTFFPDRLRPLLKHTHQPVKNTDSQTEIVERFLDMLEEFIPSANLDELLGRVVAVSTKFYRAERGALFWFRDQESGRRPELRAGYNLSAGETTSDDFHSFLSLVFKAFRQNRPLVERIGTGPGRTVDQRVKTVLCLPFEVRGRVRGVLYHDNTFTAEGFDFLDQDMLLKVARHMSGYIERIWEYSRLVEKKGRSLSEQSALAGLAADHEIIGQSPDMHRLLTQTDQAAESDAAVLILGETGVGKELLARRLHQGSSRHDGPFIVVDLTAVPEGLVESELFGHEKGAFTGAHRQKPGRLELAHHGTLFIDEVGEIPLSLQAKLLRVLQEKTFVRIGGARPQISDFRLLAATNRDLQAEVAQGRFREDLFYRLNVIPLKIPPLRDRGPDVTLLARHFLNHYSRKHHRPRLDLSPDDEKRLIAYHWPGNVRELQNIIERAVLMAVDDRLDLQLSSGLSSESTNPFADLPSMEELQRRYIRYVLDKTGGRIGGPEGAAELLGMKRSTLYTRMKKLGRM